MTEINYNSACFRRRDMLAALLLAVAFHALLFASFKAEKPTALPAVAPLPAVEVLDLDDLPPAEAAEAAAFLTRNDPAQLPVGSLKTGYSYVLRNPEFRPTMPPPAAETGKLTMPLPPPETSVAIRLPQQPPERGRTSGLIAAVLSREKTAEAVYPHLELSGKTIAVEWPPDLAAKIAALTDLDTMLEFEYSADTLLPRVTVLASCGDPALEAAIVSLLMKQGRLENKDRRQSLHIRWRKE